MNTIKRLIQKTMPFQQGIARSNISWFAAACAFYMFFSLVPIVIIVISILPYTSLTQETVLSVLSDYLPSSMEALINMIVGDVYTTSVARFSFSILATLWSSAKAFSALIRGMEAIYEKPSYTAFFKRRAMGVLYTVLFIFATLLTLSISLVTQQLTETIVRRWPASASVFDFLTHFRFVILIVILMAIFMLTYKAIPGVSVKFMRQAPGALFASITWVLFAKFFPLFISWTSSYGTYGILGTILVALLWMYYSMHIVLLGAYLNRYLAVRRGWLHEGVSS